MSAPRTQVAVIGAGMAGLEVVRRMTANAPADITVIEAGPLADTAHVNASGDARKALSLWLRTGADKYFWRGWRSATPPHYEGQSGLRRRVGGRSLYWYGVGLPIESAALDDPRWPPEVVRALRESWRGGAGLYARSVAMLEAQGYRVPTGPVRAFGGHRFVQTPRYLRRGPGEAWAAYTPLDAWRDADGCVNPACLPFRLRTGTEALALDLEAGRAAGVWIRDEPASEPRLLRAETVVLACGAIEAARLALATGRLGPGPRPVTDHLVTGVFAHLAPRTAAALAERLGQGERMAHYPEARSNFFVGLEPAPGGGAILDAQLTGEQLAGPHSSITLDPEGVPVISAGLGPEDHAVLVAQRACLAGFWTHLHLSAGLSPAPLIFGDYDANQCGNACFLDVPAIGEAITWSNTLGTEDHEAGTLAFGEALLRSGEIAALPGVFVAGAAAFPRTGAANPALTILALAQRLGTHLSERAATVTHMAAQ